MLNRLSNRRPFDAFRRWRGRFGVRLTVGVVLALGLAGVFTYVTVSEEIETNEIDAATALHRADAASLTHAAVASPKRADWLREVNEQLLSFSMRPGGLDAMLVDERSRIVAAADGAKVGSRDNGQRLADALRTGHASVGHEATRHGPGRDFEFVQPLTLHGSKYVFEITTNSDLFEAQLPSVRRNLLLSGLLAFVGAAGLFWVTGGRRVLRMHRFALERATRDGLTDLPNHLAFQDALRQTGDSAARFGESASLLLIDLDHFKSENDSRGHRYGDIKLKAATRALTGGRQTDLTFRVAGDEFALLLRRTGIEGARHAASRLRDRLADEQIVASIGAGVLREGQSPHDLLEEVEAALGEAKRAGGDRMVLFREIADNVSVLTATRRDAFLRLMADGAVDIVFQPIWDLPGDRLIGVEALARPRVDYGFAGPSEAFDTAHQLDQLHELDRLCVGRALERASELPDGVLLFINLSPKTIELDADGPHWFAEAVASSGLDPDRVVVEVTERMGSRAHTVTTGIRHLRADGFHIAIDDMGTGNSGLETLRELQPEYIKLDRSVVVGSLADRHARGLLMGVTAFAHETGAFVIAEGIEDDEVLEFVNTLPAGGKPRIQGGQGYGLGRPDSQFPSSLGMPRGCLPGVAVPTRSRSTRSSLERTPR
jgi:diguanylate cyclase (GGDEF)-like protein